ncbi:MAG: TraA family conjugative transfer protein [Dissulfuribacterales bacterium]
MKKLSNKKTLAIVAVALLAVVVIVPVIAHASVGEISGEGASQIYTTIKGWLEGTMGQAIAIAAFAVGLGFSIARQSLAACAVGLGFALVLYYGPGVIGGVFTLGIPM